MRALPRALPRAVARPVALAALLAACVGQRQPEPVVLPPQTIAVRIDSSGAAAVVADAPPAAGRSAAARAAVVEDDPFFGIDRVEWPGPNQYRSSDGSPGPAYWQQRADYTIAATLDTAAQTVSGRVTIRYTNNSPDTLRFVWLQLDQNIYRPGSLGAAINPADSRWGARDFAGGYRLSEVTANGRPARHAVDDTRMRIDLERPLAPKGGTATFAMEFSFRVPEHGSDRMGRDGTLYEIAQWYPRMAVYDDVRGWNAEPYLGQGEFYLEYGDFDYAITAPAGYLIAGSGVLRNPEEVLTVAQRERLARAARSQRPVQIVTAAESAPRPAAGTKTWRFRAENVRDVAWAGAPDFRWDAVACERALCQAYYPWPRAGAGWENGAENTQWSIRTYSELVLPYPYPQATSVAGPVGGMEYPMFVMVHYAREPEGAFGTIDHEHGHEWFPMIVGSNERRFAWMDEGFNTYINAFSDERRTAGVSAWTGLVRNWRDIHARGISSPLMTPPDRIDRAALGAIAYRKPGAVMLTLRNHVVGRETFDAAFREYARRWAFRHPTPGDFFRTVENHAGEDLSWFWRGFFYADDVLDIGIEGVEMASAEGAPIARVTLRRHTAIPFPVTLRLKLEDGSTMDARLPVQIWSRGDRHVAELAVTGRVAGARLWPDPSVPDWDPANDAWGDAPPADPLGPVTLEASPAAKPD